MNVYLLLKNVVSYFNSTSNHNAKVLAAGNITLFLISILHQTTTTGRVFCISRSCFLFQFYIKPQPAMRRCTAMRGCFLFQFYIKPQLRRPPSHRHQCCFLFQFYIKPQLKTLLVSISSGCFLFQFYIKPQPFSASASSPVGCFLFQFYIKPQPRICDLLIVIRLCGRMNGTNGA